MGEYANRLSHNDDTGWLIGEAVAIHGELRGTMEFYGYKEPRDARGVSKGLRQVWGPKRLAG